MIHRALLSAQRLRKAAGCRRNFAVFGVGEGWTGSLGQEMLEDTVPGHYEDEDDEDEEGYGTREPHLLYDSDVVDAAAGWGHSVLITSDHKLMMIGRPHDFSTLLRIHRLPEIMRRHSIRSTMRLESSSTGNKPLPSWHPSRLASQLIGLLVGKGGADEPDWDEARMVSIVPALAEVDLPTTGTLTQVEASAGLTSVLTSEGRVYSFGLNTFGQCGTGSTSNNVWTPTPIDKDMEDDDNPVQLGLDEEFVNSKIALGLQHGHALTTEGQILSWGKADRGQLGIDFDDRLSSVPRRIPFVRTPERGETVDDVRFKTVSAGMSRSAALEADGTRAYHWGKNVVPSPDTKKVVTDVFWPVAVRGVPSDREILDVTCGGVHTAVLLDDGSVWAVGLPCDSTTALVNNAQEIIPAGVVELPVRHFQAQWDRTTVVDASGHVVETQLWSTPELQKDALYSPAWMDHLGSKDVQSVHRGWLHTLIVTKDK